MSRRMLSGDANHLRDLHQIHRTARSVAEDPDRHGVLPDVAEAGSWERWYDLRNGVASSIGLATGGAIPAPDRRETARWIVAEAGDDADLLVELTAKATRDAA